MAMASAMGIDYLARPSGVVGLMGSAPCSLVAGRLVPSVDERGRVPLPTEAVSLRSRSPAGIRWVGFRLSATRVTRGDAVARVRIGHGCDTLDLGNGNGG